MPPLLELEAEEEDDVLDDEAPLPEAPEVGKMEPPPVPLPELAEEPPPLPDELEEPTLSLEAQLTTMAPVTEERRPRSTRGARMGRDLRSDRPGLTRWIEQAQPYACLWRTVR